MITPPSFKVRVQLSFSGCEEQYSNRSMQVDARVAELFYSKNKKGTLRQWLLQLAYEAAEKEIDFEIAQAEQSIPTEAVVRQAKPVSSVEPVARKGDEQKPAQKLAPKAVRVEAPSPASALDALEPVAQSVIEVEQVDDDLRGYMPLVLSDDKEKKKGRPMPGSFKNLVLDPD